MGTEDRNEETIFNTAVQLNSPAAREAYLSAACGNDRKLRTAVEELLKQHDVNSFLDVPPVDSDITIDDSPVSEGPGTVIGRYKLLEKIGEGGMAVVYMAEQEEPIRRKVALKIIKLGMDTKSVIARFEAERQALAMMEHPNIAKVLDAGATETGRPYFVMELVKGVSITDYCDANSLSTKERLELFIQVCNAVQHAHQKGIIHRDIKPTNVMVTLHDGQPVPKVIDFGIAKAINQKLTEKTLFTRYAHIIGTPAYMSPEQAELSDLDIDTRTDIYSLGVLLYELLTGTTPFGEEELRKAGYIEMQRVIREQEPVKPSTKLSTLGKTLTDVAKRRNSTPDLLRKAVRGDLDWIVMKSLEKDRARRYETASSLSLDIRRHLDHEPVMARGPSTTYRIQKFLRRHRSQTIAALALAVTAGALSVIFSMWNKDRLQLAEAEGLRNSAILSQAREQYAKADRDAALETIKPILQSEHVGPEAQLLQAGILVDNRRSDEAMTVLNNLLDKPPEISGAAHALLARILWESESPDAKKLKEINEHRQKAEALLPETAEAYFLRAMSAVTVKEQLASLDRALQLDPSHYESRRLRAFTYYASRKYDKMKDDALVMAVSRPRDSLGHSLRAIALRDLGKYAEAITEYDNAIRLTAKGGPQHIDLSSQRCEAFLRMGDYERVIAEAREGLTLSPDRPVFQYYTFSALTALGEYDKADTVFREIVRRTPTSRNELREWCAKYVFDTLEAGRSWHPPSTSPPGARSAGVLSAAEEPSSTRSAPARDLGAAFLPLVEAEEIYRALSAKAHRLTTDGFSARWSPDGKKLAFSAGVQGYSGVAVFDPATKETELLIVPGKDPKWSPDGRYIAFVRDRQALRLEELARAERDSPYLSPTDEEVWIMKADGTDPRRLAAGGWPSWSADSAHVYLQSRLDNTLCSVSIEGQNAEPKRIMACPSYHPSVSPDNQRVAYVEYQSLKVMDLTTQTSVAEWRLPFSAWGGPAWSPTGKELCLGAGSSVVDRTGLWIYPLDSNQPVKVLDSQIMAASWAPDGTKLVFGLRPPYFELWSADLIPNAPTIEALGPGQTLGEHWDQMLRLYTRRMKADPQDASAYADRARYYDYLHDRAKANADMGRWSAVMSGKSPSDLLADTPRSIRRVINGPFGYKIVFSAERPVNVNEIPLFNIALGQKPSGSFVQPGCDSSTKTAKKGRCNMKSFQIPMLATRGLAMSLFGLCLLSGLDTPPARADFVFGEAVNLGPRVNSLQDDGAGIISEDGLALHFSSNRPGGYGGWDIWVSTRAGEGEEWGIPTNVGPFVNSSQVDIVTSLSPDGLEMYLFSTRTGGHGRTDLYVSTRPSKDAPWAPPVNLGATVNTPSSDESPIISSDGLALLFHSNRPGGAGACDIYLATRLARSDPWGPPTNLGPTVNSSNEDFLGCLSPDGLRLFLSSDRPGGFGGLDAWMAARPSKDLPWTTPVNLGPSLNTIYCEWIDSMSRDGLSLYFTDGYYSVRPGGIGGSDIWQAPLIRIVDFNADGKVDIADVAIMIEHWHTDYSLCDIGPMPWGDGFVDAQDLRVLAEHLFEGPRPTAHWKLDEAEGSAASDSAGPYDAELHGGPVWQPSAGKEGGALQFDGTNDYVSTPFILDPAKGSFSVFAWAKPSGRGQVIISQNDGTGTRWLWTDPSYGRLTTWLMHPPFDPLMSNSTITDGQWHHVGLVFDFEALRRYLYVDGREAAKDTAFVGGVNSSGGLYFGADKTLNAGTFFSGLIDDVRIYNRAVRP